jgi:hypothetical protein
LKISARHLKRYKEIGLLLLKYGRGDLVTALGMQEAFDPDHAQSNIPSTASPDQLAGDLEAMGPTFVKLGQVLSSRPDLLPAPYLQALARLQDKVEPFSYADVERIADGDQREGRRIRRGTVSTRHRQARGPHAERRPLPTQHRRHAAAHSSHGERMRAVRAERADAARQDAAPARRDR